MIDLEQFADMVSLCPCGGTDVRITTFRDPGESPPEGKKDRRNCEINGIPRGAHRCITDCCAIGQYCPRCALLRPLGITMYQGEIHQGGERRG